jgi:hypothetical protein
MARTPTWFARTEEIRDKVKAASSPLIDRAAIEQLFSLKTRQAATLLTKIGGESGERVGGANTVRREALLAFLDGKREEPAARAEQQRNNSLAGKLRAIRAAGPTLRADLRPPLTPSPQADSLLPAAIHLAGPGRLEIRYRSPGDVLAAILRLAELSETNPAGFENSLQYQPPEEVDE